MKTNPSETRFTQLVSRIGEWAKVRKLDKPDIDLIVDLTVALREAEKALIEAGLFAQMAAAPHAMNFGWASGAVPFDPAAAMGLLVHEAAHVEAMIAEGLYPDNSSGAQPEEESGREVHHYVISQGSTEITIDSSVPLSEYDLSEIVLRCLTPLCLSIERGTVIDSVEFDGPLHKIIDSRGQVVGTALGVVSLGMILPGRRGV